MTIKQKIEKLKKHYNQSKFKPFLTSDLLSIAEIDFEKKTVDYYQSVTLSCGCCTDYVYNTMSLNSFLKDLSEDDFDELLNELMSSYSLEETKSKMKAYIDFFGGKMNSTDIENAKSLEELSEIFDKHYDFLGDMANDAQHSLNRFKNSLKIFDLI